MLVIRQSLTFSQPRDGGATVTEASGIADPSASAPRDATPGAMPAPATPAYGSAATTPGSARAASHALPPVSHGAHLADHGRASHERYRAAVAASEGSTGSGGPAAAVGMAEKLVGAHERRDNALIREYLRTGGHGMNPADTAWCAAFVGASLRKAGVKDTGSNMAVSYEHWGRHVDPGEGVKRGDVFVEEHGHGLGHTGFLTGRVDERGRVEVVSGNYSNQVKKAWEEIGPHHSQIRRATSKEYLAAAAASDARAARLGAARNSLMHRKPKGD